MTQSLVAFNAPGGRVRSAKIELRSTANKRLKVVTEYGASYNISYDDVIWVKSGKRWHGLSDLDTPSLTRTKKHD